jgi:tRNA modification GTPase
VRFLGPERVEVHCHGGSWAAERILRGLESTGCQRESDRFALSLDPELDPIAQQALRCLSQAASLRTAAYLLEQFHGALRTELTAICEAALQQRGVEVVRRLERLDRCSEFGRHLTEPWRVVIAGPPNAGKSTLLNALLGFPRALVHDEAGTTRDLLEENSLIDGWPVVICDTAGIRSTRQAIELAGIELARQAVESADLVILVSDARERTKGVPRVEFPTQRMIHVANKCDLLEDDTVAELLQELPVSALHGQGVPELIGLIAKSLVPDPPPLNAPIPFTTSLAETVRDAVFAARQQQWPEVTRSLASRMDEVVPLRP